MSKEKTFYVGGVSKNGKSQHMLVVKNNSVQKQFKYRKGDIVVWSGRNPVIGILKGDSVLDKYLSSECAYMDEKYNSLDEMYLRHATRAEKHYFRRVSVDGARVDFDNLSRITELTVHDWLYEMPTAIRIKAITNIYKNCRQNDYTSRFILNQSAMSLEVAISLSFPWYSSDQGSDYWLNVLLTK